tara:strand:- start:1469 stop:3214 length:1746 start_codon:yes stop_codon:yes gene_type:complete
MIKDFISGLEIKETPEEIEAVQVYSKILVNDYLYEKNTIQTHPQYRVKVRPSAKTKDYPIDIAVFDGPNKTDDNLKMVVECKRKNEKDGLNQLKDYLRFCSAEIGIWFNGEKKTIIKKFESKGKVYFEEIPDIPRFGQRLEDIGLFKRKDLKTPSNIKSLFISIRNYLAGSNVGATRDEFLAQQLINMIFCKIYDEKFTKPDDTVKFRAGINEKHPEISKRIKQIFSDLKSQYSDVIDENEKIDLNDKSIVHIVGALQSFSITNAPRDAIGDAFEVFIGKALKGGQGQFFTPRNVVKMVIDMLNPGIDDKIIDPACGSGGFLIECLRHVWTKVEKRGTKLGWPKSEIEIEKQKTVIKNFRGIDKDSFLAKVTKVYMAILGDGRGGIFCENSLEEPKNWSSKANNNISLGSFDVVITNPPFGKNINIDGEDLLKQYEFGHKWKFLKKENKWIREKLKDKEAPQTLFIERCLEFLKPGGKLGIVLPDGILGNDKLGYIRQHLLSNAKILAIIDLPIITFMPNTSTKTSVIILEKTLNKPNLSYEIFMSIPKTCGHDRRGKEIADDDIVKVPLEFTEWKKNVKS